MAQIRPATGQDAAAIARVHVRIWQSTYAGIVPHSFLASLGETERTQQWTAWLKLDLPVYVAELDGKVVGFIGGGPIRDPLPGYDAELFALYLLESAQRQGIGTALLHTLAAALTARNFGAMIAWVLESNASRHFYQHTGASPIERKAIEVGGALLPAQAYGWPVLASLF